MTMEDEGTSRRRRRRPETRDFVLGNLELEDNVADFLLEDSTASNPLFIRLES